MIGTPPSARKLLPIPSNSAEHAEQFAHTWVDRLEHHVEGRMHALSIPEHQIGASDPAHGVPWRVFFPHERIGGSVLAGGRICVDSGVLNPELLIERYGASVGMIWEKSRLRDRIDAIIVHELTESWAGSHDSAEALAPETDLPISVGARRILLAMSPQGKTPED
jgi:hypothetical protein